MFVLIRGADWLRVLFRRAWLRLCHGKALSMGRHVTFRHDFTIRINQGARLSIGSDVFFNNGCSIACCDHISIGDLCLFGENVKIYDHNHVYSNRETAIQAQGFSSSPVSIGKNCWVASGVIILKGVTIGDDCIIGAGCVIHKDIPSGSVVKNHQNLFIESRK